jgi:hypothetical protein
VLELPAALRHGVAQSLLRLAAFGLEPVTELDRDVEIEALEERPSRQRERASDVGFVEGVAPGP